MKFLGPLLLWGGFAWIAFVSLHNWKEAKTGWSDAVEFHARHQAYTREEAWEAMRTVAAHIESHQHSPLWGGVAMLAGASIRIAQKPKPVA